MNLHDDSLEFEPIHRVVFGVEPEALLEALRAYYPGAHEGQGEGHTIAYTHAGGTGCLTVPNPRVQLPVGTLQNFLDAYLKEHGGEVDYIHGEAEARALAEEREDAVAFLLPPPEWSALFDTVTRDGLLPRKTFSVGRAQDKRFYLEARKIRR